MPKARIFAEEFRYGKHDERKSHAYGKPREYGREACDKSDSPQIFKATYPDDGCIPLVFFRDFCSTCGSVQINGPERSDEDDERRRQVKGR